MSRTHGESTRKERIHLIPSHQPAGSRTESVQGSQRDPRFMAPPFRRYSQVIAVYDGGTRRMWMVRRDVPILLPFAARFLLRSVFGIFPGLSCFLLVQRFLGRARVFRGFRHFRRFPVLSESRFQSPGWKPSSPRVPAPAGTAWMETLPSGLSEGLRQSSAGYPGWKPCHLEAGSSTTSTGSSGTPRFRRPAGTSLRPELRGLRFDQFGGFRGPEVASSGHTGSLPGCVEQGVLCPGGGKVGN